MRTLLLVTVFLTAICAQVAVKEAPGRSVIYELAPEKKGSAKSVAPGENQKGSRYYINGDGDRPIESTGTLIVSFTGEVDAKAFAARWDLQNPRRLSRSFATWAFENASGVDDAALASQIGASEPNIRFAKPEWKANRVHK